MIAADVLADLARHFDWVANAADATVASLDRLDAAGRPGADKRESARQYARGRAQAYREAAGSVREALEQLEQPEE